MGRSTTRRLNELVDWQIAQGTQVLSPVGTTGESPTLSHDEHERVIAAVVEQRRGPGQGAARHRLERHQRGDPPDPVRRQGRSRRGADRGPLL